MHPVSLYTDEYKKAATKNVTALSLFLLLISYSLFLTPCSPLLTFSLQIFLQLRSSMHKHRFGSRKFRQCIE